MARSAILPPLVTEQALIEACSSLRGDRILVISPGRGQAAWHFTQRLPTAQVSLWYADLHAATLAEQAVQEQGLEVRVTSGADLPDESFDLIAVPILLRGEAEWTRDVLQQAHQRLVHGGHLIASVDNPRDQWLHEQLQEMFIKVTCQSVDQGRVYSAKKTSELKKQKNFRCEFAFRDEERLIHALSRPGVFSHRRIDPGARQLLRTVEIEPGQHVLDLGCGSGVLSLASALRADNVQVFAVDSHARAIACVEEGAVRNQIANIQTVWNADGLLDLGTPIDIVLANPPYYGDFAIAAHFLEVALRVLRPGGAALFVNKHPDWYREQFSATMSDVEIFPSGKYHVACGRR